MLEHRGGVRRVNQLASKVLTRPVLVLMHGSTPLGAVSHIINDAGIGNILAQASLAVKGSQLLVGELAFAHDTYSPCLAVLYTHL
jgi:hypothetical protein